MKILILGGGITGLSSAWYISKKYPKAQITLLEKTNRLGGWIQTSREGGFLFEKGPRTFMLGKCPHLLDLMNELELNVITAAPQSRYILHKGALRPVQSFLPMLLPYLIFQPFMAPAKENESIYDFAKRRFSKKIAETLFDPLTLGIYAGDIRKLSMRACFPHFSFKKSKGLFTVQEGMDTLVKELQKRLPVDFVFNSEVDFIEENRVSANGKIWDADLVISTLPPTHIPKKSLWVVNVAYSSDVLSKKGFGYLVPSKEKESLLGVIFDSSIFPEQNKQGQTRLTAMVRAEEKEPLKAVLSALDRHLHIKDEPSFSSSFLAIDAIPQFEVGCQDPFGISVEACVKRGKNFK